MSTRPDTRTEAEKQFANRFQPILERRTDPDATAYDGRIAELRQRKHNLATDEGYADFLDEKREAELTERDVQKLNREYMARREQDPTVQRLRKLHDYYNGNETVDAKLLQQLSHTIEQWVTPGASQIVAESMARNVFEVEQKRRDTIKADLESQRMAFEAGMMALKGSYDIDGPDVTTTPPPAPVSFEKSIRLKNQTVFGRASELWLALPENGPERAEVDTAFEEHKRGRTEALNEVVAKYAAPGSEGENDAN